MGDKILMNILTDKIYSREVKEFIDQKLSLQKEKQKESILQYTGIADGDIGENRIQELREEREV